MNISSIIFFPMGFVFFIIGLIEGDFVFAIISIIVFSILGMLNLKINSRFKE